MLAIIYLLFIRINYSSEAIEEQSKRILSRTEYVAIVRKLCEKLLIQINLIRSIYTLKPPFKVLTEEEDIALREYYAYMVNALRDIPNHLLNFNLINFYKEGLEIAKARLERIDNKMQVDDEEKGVLGEILHCITYTLESFEKETEDKNLYFYDKAKIYIKYSEECLIYIGVNTNNKKEYFKKKEDKFAEILRKKFEKIFYSAVRN